MKVTLNIDNRKYEVDASPNGDGTFNVTVGTRRFSTRLEDAAAGSFKVAVGDKKFDITLNGDGNGSDLEISSNGRRISVKQLAGRKPKPRKRKVAAATSSNGNGTASAGAEPGAIVAPMPGTVLAVDKKVGDKVEAGERIMTIEAMKMENEIRTEQAGTVKEIRVKAGSAVMSHEVLAVVK